MSYHQSFPKQQQRTFLHDFLEHCRDERSINLGVVARAGRIVQSGMPYLGTSAVRLAYFSPSLASPALVMPQDIYHLFFLLPGTLERPLEGVYMSVNPLLEMGELAREAAEDCSRSYARLLEQSGLQGLDFQVQAFIAPSPVHSTMFPVGRPYDSHSSSERRIIPFSFRR